MFGLIVFLISIVLLVVSIRLFIAALKHWRRMMSELSLEEAQILMVSHQKQLTELKKAFEKYQLDLKSIANDLAFKQQPLGKDFERVLFDNLEDLYVTDAALEKGDEAS